MYTDNDILELLVSDPGAHDNGPTEMANILDCARRVRLDKEQGGYQDPLSLGNLTRNIGSVVHKMRELHERGLNSEEFFPAESANPGINAILKDPGKGNGCSAWTLFDRYREVFFPGWWGHSVVLEKRLEGEFNGHQIAGTLDAIHYVTEAVRARIYDQFQVFLPRNGNYVWDLKTAKAKDELLSERYAWHPATPQYLTLARMHEYNPQGTIYFKAVRYTGAGNPNQFSIGAHMVEDVLSHDGLLRYTQRLEKVAERKENDMPALSDTVCLNYGICPHRVSGACTGCL